MVRKSHDASKAIANLQNGANKIGDIVHFIGDIADQTNLLALNATIAAARAGEATTEISSHVSNLLKAIEATEAVNTTANSTGEMAKELADAAQSLSQKGSVIAGELDVFLSNLKTQ